MENKFLAEFNMTPEEKAYMAKGVFYTVDPPRLKVLSPKLKKKLVALEIIAALFEEGRVYSEMEVNAVLAPVYEDYATLRRALVDFKFLSRGSDCRNYTRTAE